MGQSKCLRLCGLPTVSVGTTLLCYFSVIAAIETRPTKGMAEYLSLFVDTEGLISYNFYVA